ncbi:MAG TPA: glucosamine-6-phosphate deaminase [Vicinamibacterales bacterium]|nr:glucosamine-6-phosphate deaminase [Vicinamibacterales bacterium]
MTRVRVFSSADALARALARDVARRLAVNPRLVIGLPTGRTPIPFYEELVRLYRSTRVDLREATTFNLDEFLGLESSDPRSYRAFMERHLFDHVNIASWRIHFLNGAATDVGRECLRYERAIARAGGIDIQILGLGLNGHVGFNEPGRALAARTHCTRLTEATRHANAALFGNRVSAVPRRALSMGMATILQARRIVLIATGASKARCVERMIEGPVTPHLPASFLQLHANAEVWVDGAAAGNAHVIGN